MIILDYQDRRPIYEQVVEKIQLLIVRGVLAPNSQLPSVRKLATELSINPNTIQRAYASHTNKTNTLLTSSQTYVEKRL